MYDLRSRGGVALLTLFFKNTCEYHSSVARDPAIHRRLLGEKYATPSGTFLPITTTLKSHPDADKIFDSRKLEFLSHPRTEHKLELGSCR